MNGMVREKGARPDNPLAMMRTSQKALAIAVLMGVFVLNMLARLVFGPLLPEIERDLGLSHATSGGVFLMIACGYVVSTLSSGFVSARITHRCTIMVSAAVRVLGMAIIAAGGTLAALRAGLLVLGVGAGLYLPSGYAVITSLVGRDLQGRAIAAHETAPAFAFMAAPLLVQLLLPLGSWRWTVAVLAAASVLTLAVYASVGRGGAFRGRSPSVRGVSLLVWRPAFALMLAFVCVIGAASMGGYSILPVYLVSEHDRSLVDVNVLVAASRVSALPLVFVAGWLADRIGPRPVGAWTATGAGVATILIGVTSGALPSAFVIVQPFFIQAFWPAALAALGTLSPPRMRSLLVSLTVPFVYLFGAGIAPALWGVLGDAGRFDLGFVLFGAAALAFGGQSTPRRSLDPLTTAAERARNLSYSATHDVPTVSM